MPTGKEKKGKGGINAAKDVKITTDEKDKLIDYSLDDVLNDPCKLMYIKPLGTLSETLYCSSHVHNKY